jgi:serine protease Do
MTRTTKGILTLTTFLAATACTSCPRAQAQYSRRTPIVEAVQKTRAGIVTIKVEKRDGYEQSRETTGTGVIVDERGYVVTSCHVVAAAQRVRAVLADGTELSAQVLVEEPGTDLAILRVRSQKALQALPLGPGSDLMVGETVIAVGHPYGYVNTVSTGIISALSRKITMPTGEGLTNLIQTNASINPGNSGGPLLNINGELIGINAALRDGAQGIAFAINAETVKTMLQRHLNILRVAGVDHGLYCTERVNPEGRERQHVVVAEVAQATPASAAGVKPGDEILRVAGQSVCNPFDVERALWGYKAGERVSLALVRRGREMTLNLTLAEGTEARRTAAAHPAPPDRGTAGPARAASNVKALQQVD